MIGKTLSHYQVTAALGAGGMGEVYRATDTKLKRDVAIKMLPDELAQDPERLARFQREAELLASLNHPHIAAIHGLEEADGRPLLILELVVGEDLSTRLERGPIPVGEALEIATQITDALEAAHEKGIVHRDLKPANVKITPEGLVKILDFGLAKAWSMDPATGASSIDVSQSPTLAHSGTAAGLILGTAAYMSPEQAMGKAVDKRADVWAFGVVLFEMLTGERLFAGENTSEVLASVIKDDPEWGHLPAGTPASIHRLLRRCLRKKPKERLRDIGDAWLEVEDVAGDAGESGGAAAGARATGRERLAWALAVVLPIAAGLAGWSLRPPPTRGPLHLSVPLAPTQLAGTFAVSPDGSKVAFSSGEEGGRRRLTVRALDEPTVREFPGTEDARNPFFSPDGQWIVFFAGTSALKKVPVEGGPAVVVTGGNQRASSGTWTEDGWIVMGGDLRRVPAGGGSLEPLEVRNSTHEETVVTVSRIDGSQRLLLAVTAGSVDSNRAVAIQSLETGERHVLVPGGDLPRYLASGHVVYRHSGRLVAQRLDVDGMRLVGPPVPLQAVTGDEDIEYFDVSPTGVLLFISTRAEEQRALLAWTDRDGSTTPLAFEAWAIDPRISPDGTRVAHGRAGDVWLLDLERGTRTRVSTATGGDETATWSPDGRWIAWAGNRSGQARALYRRRSDGSGPEERLWSDARHFHAASWSPVGIVMTLFDPATGWDVLLLDPEDPSQALPLLNTAFNEKTARVSPDGRLLAFVSDETGRDEVYVQSFPRPGAKVQVSIDGGLQPVWRPGTREIVFRGSGKIMSAALGPGDSPTVSAPHALFDDRLRGLGPDDHTPYAVDRDGRILAVDAREQLPRRHLRIVLDWMEAAGLEP